MEETKVLAGATVAGFRILLGTILLLVGSRRPKTAIFLLFIITLPVTSYYAIQNMPADAMPEPLLQYIPRGTASVHWAWARGTWHALFYNPVGYMQDLYKVGGMAYRAGNAMFVTGS